ncbi:substrate-binding domain-containing protein [Epibacterium ulvae]|uniref:substrate-binding domain-containing protein n=1 Tax=Epibacterium ulvae TaxID=1156985 RepID=UPI001BFCA304|nr:substrate-binding domain-containing protein [Epibacterium ulvae]MBT8155760.1 substrate-binding domain-containing protein [Epibacterium ulvae]
MEKSFLGAKQKPVWRYAREALDGCIDLLGPSSAFRIGLLVPMSGSAGLWGPSCIASTQLAVHELNNAGGIAGKPVEIFVLDAAAETADETEETLRKLIDQQAIDAIVGMHISAVRDQLIHTIGGRIPFIYTPLYEGAVNSPEVFTIGDTPEKLLGPSITKLTEDFKISNWALVGNDYVWPRVSHRFARNQIAELGANIAIEKYVPFGSDLLETTIEKIKSSGADGVLVSLVGQDAVDFNRLFGRENLHQQAVRLSCAIEENGLLASGAKNVERLFCSSTYFGCMNTNRNANFREKYHSLHGDRAPMLNALGQSAFEGVKFLARLMDRSDIAPKPNSAVSYEGVRNATYISNSKNPAPVYLARANGNVFDDLRQIG